VSLLFEYVSMLVFLSIQQFAYVGAKHTVSYRFNSKIILIEDSHVLCFVCAYGRIVPLN
jgi:hypothetical protein